MNTELILFGYPLFEYSDFGLLVVRLAIGLIFFIHGNAKLKSGTPMNFRLLGISEVLSAIVIVLGVGIFAQIVALWLAIVMVGAIYFKIEKWKVPFTAENSTGWEFDLILLAANLLIFFLGSGFFSISGMLYLLYTGS